jgi:lipopolysaccharide export system protein LptA
LIGSRRVLAIVCALWLAATPRWGVGAPAPTISVTADAMDVDADARVVTATGRVRITDGRTTATARRATLYQREGRAVLAGDARTVGPAGVMAGAEITIAYAGRAITRVVARGGASLEFSRGVITAADIAVVLVSDLVTAAGSVRVSAPPDGVATGDRLTYDRTREAATLEGGARLEHRDGVITGTRIEGTARWQRAVIQGPVWSRFRNIEIRSRSAELVRAEQKATFTGDVEITQAGRQLTTERATVWYGSGRIVAEGATKVRLEIPP